MSHQGPPSPDDYYGWGARVQLNAPFVITGPTYDDVVATTRYVGAMTGLSYVLADDVLAHEMGLSPEAGRDRIGFSQYRARIRAIVLREIERRPFGLVTIPHDCLWTGDAEKVLSGAKLVWVQEGVQTGQVSKLAQVLEWLGLRRHSKPCAPGVNHIVAYEKSAAKMAGHLAAYLINA